MSDNNNYEHKESKHLTNGNAIAITSNGIDRNGIDNNVTESLSQLSVSADDENVSIVYDVSVLSVSDSCNDSITAVGEHLQQQNAIKLLPNKSTYHPTADPPICPKCLEAQSTVFDMECGSCRALLSSESTTISEIFAIMRQWVPQTQRSIDLLVKEVLRRGAHIDDRDSMTDMTLLHYACKAGANGVGSVDNALQTVRHLIESLSANVTLRCEWTDMSAIHYAVFFDVGHILDYLLLVTQNKYIDDPCRDFDGGTPLHIAAANMCVQCTRILLKNGANVLLKDDMNRTPLDCVPDSLVHANLMPEELAQEITSEIRKLLEEATLACIPGEGFENNGLVTGKVVLQALGLNLGDRVVISDTKVGTLRYCGATQFATSIWAGIELDEPEGKNDGTVGGITYFRCPPKHGIFAPINKISRYGENLGKYLKGMNGAVNGRNINHRKVDVSRVTPKVKTGLTTSRSKSVNLFDVNIGNRVQLSDKRIGYVRYSGGTQFAAGTWYGIEFDKPVGKNDGSVDGVRYFQCKPKHGIFATISRISRVLRDKKQTDIESDDNSSDLSLTVSQSSTDNDVFKNGGSNTKKAKLKFSSITTKSTQSSPTQQQQQQQQSSQSSPNGNTWLTVGVNVFINNSIGVVRYIGSVHFAQGIWLGVELRTAMGKNDGTVQNKRYFHCKPNHGLLVRPKKVSVRGINGATLLPE